MVAETINCAFLTQLLFKFIDIIWQSVGVRHAAENIVTTSIDDQRFEKYGQWRILRLRSVCFSGQKRKNACFVT
ncbi:hypothetical protein [Desulfogranum marinum]|uniref:hypothetical protein n=1 Tax=Desulfogranum marinum TaxID=453220 RepID=UPI0019626F7A|nr:hypothetical protein [Desulfogranum marinum]MBM9511531.1 hypothetical protein [Desulfogranum marinum]